MSCISNNELTDEELVELSRHDKTAASELIARYFMSVEVMAKKYAPYSDREQTVKDLVQEGLLALLNAADNYKSDKGSGFSAYASVCIRNRMLKYLVRNNKNSDAADVSPEELEVLAGADYNNIPDDLLVEQELAEELYNKVSVVLSKLEWKVLACVAEGMTYSDIENKTGIPVKAANNAMQRVRRKLKEILGNDVTDNAL